MIEVEITIRRLRRGDEWLVEATSPARRDAAYVSPLTDADLGALGDALPPEARSWPTFVERLSPLPGWRPGWPTLRTVGGLLMQRLLRAREIAEHIARVETLAAQEPGVLVLQRAA